MLLAQITDTHVLADDSGEPGVVDNTARLALAVESINAERPAPDMVVATGDLTNDGKPGELAELVRLLGRLNVPVLVLPGNHDHRASMKAAFDQPWADAEHLSWVADVGEVRIVGLDTQLPGEGGGMFDPEREAWLAGALADAAAADRPVVIAMHHPPFASGLAWMDGGQLARADAFAEVVRANPHVTRILCGHLHRPVVTTVGGVTTSVGLSTVHAVALDLRPDANVSLIVDPAGYQLHHFDGAGWVSHTRYIDTGHAPFTPEWATVR